MENIINTIVEIVDSFKTFDWAAFFLVWLSIERILRGISRITPWKWDDDLVNWLATTFDSLKKKKESDE